jgi:hypothetical protein
VWQNLAAWLDILVIGKVTQSAMNARHQPSITIEDDNSATSL